MKFRATILAALTGLFFYASTGWCRTAAMDGPMTDSNAALGQTYQKRFNLNTDDHDVDYVSAQVVYSSGNFASQSFVDGRASTGTITVVTATALSTAAATGKMTIVSATVAAGSISTASISVITNTTGTVINITGPPGGLRFQLGGNWPALGAASDLATSLTGLINASSNTTGVTAQTSGSLVKLFTISSGTAYNSFAVTSTTPTAVSTAAFTGGTQPVQVAIGPIALLAGRDFVIGASSATMAFNISQIVNASSMTTLITSTASTVCVGTADCGVIYATATVPGTAANAYALTTSNSLAVSTSASNLSGGTDNAVFCLNGTCLTANKHWYPTAIAATTADSLYKAINSSFSIVLATDTASTGVIYTTAVIVGTGGNYTMSSSSNPALLLNTLVSSSAVTGASTGIMAGGVASAFTIGTQNLTVPAHGWPTALVVSVSSVSMPVIYYSTVTSGGTATPLASGTSFYIIPVNTNTVQLSWTSTGAVAGLALTWASSQTKTTADTYTLNVATAAGAASYGWYESNDGTNFWQVPGTATTTITTGDAYIYPSTFTWFDFGNVTAKWLQLNVAPPAVGGAIAVKANIHGEHR